MKTKLNELLEFPTPFTYKVMGQALPELVDQVVEVVQRHAPVITLRSKTKQQRNYHSVSITINATHIEQVETCTKSWAISISFGWCCNPSLTRPCAGSSLPAML
jgi:putative lipoic acid-binding regulatory protein